MNIDYLWILGLKSNFYYEYRNIPWNIAEGPNCASNSFANLEYQ